MRYEDTPGGRHAKCDGSREFILTFQTKGHNFTGELQRKKLNSKYRRTGIFNADAIQIRFC